MAYWLSEKIIFPPIESTDENGIIAIGGDLSLERILLAYKQGIFPWYNMKEPILWWFPNPRLILYPSNIHISKSMKRIINKKKFFITYDKAFYKVISQCKKIHFKQKKATWITNEMIEAYYKLYLKGYAHSVECWYNNELVGGLYGVSLGKCFFGESMFSTIANASKIALIDLCYKLYKLKFIMIDCQVYSDHFKKLGAILIEKNKFSNLLEKALKFNTIKGSWEKLI